jgi:4-aminobutyrate aminotransferase / (S)-3-amino-2-methylpropionate transaminase / 5-aminovalerate transaminase
MGDAPGPRSRELQAERDRYLPRGMSSAMPAFAASGSGATLTDVDGQSYIDFATGISVMNVGHGHPRVLTAIREQAERLVHSGAPVMMPEAYVRLARRLCEITPGAFPKKALLLNSGAEAVENAVKVARFFTGRPAVICFEHGFHGRTNLAMALTAKVMPYKKGFGPFAPEVYRIPFPYCYRCEQGPVSGRCCLADRTRLEQTLAGTVDPGSVAAIIMELELGEGGFVPAPVEYVQMLAAFAREHGILFIADEIQTGFGRTGKLFASEHYGLVPDIVITAKSLAGGLPLAAVTGRAEVLEAAHVGGLGGTYGGNPLACAAALAVLDAMEAERIPARAQRTGDRIKARFLEWAEQYPCIGDIRGLGAMIGMELVTDRRSRTPDKALTGRILAAALAKGLLLLSAGTYGNVIRVLAPLNASDELVDEGLAAFGAALELVAGRAPVLA